MCIRASARQEEQVMNILVIQHCPVTPVGLVGEFMFVWLRKKII